MTGAERMERLVGILAADSMEGRATGSDGARRAARFIARELESYGVDPAYETGFSQPIPLRRILRPDGREQVVLASAGDLPEGTEVLEELADANVVGVIRGGDPDLSEEAVILGAHFDHVGVGRAVEGDSIYNGADDDASGVAVVLEVARLMAASEPPGRTVVFLLTTGEELGLLGTRFYIENPVIPMERTVADLQVEMVGRPDSLAGGVGRAWLTGFDRSTLGAALAEAGVPIVPDPRPDQRFFSRSDNIAFATLGIPAHTLSSFNLHDDYHRPSDEARFMDYEHMAAVTEAAATAVRILAEGPRPEWNPGGRPEMRPGGRR
jgi:Zn-dependent M28 family amino/carboxypeptidase